MMVADGVGGGSGEAASRTAVEAVTQYVEQRMRCYYAGGAADDRDFYEALQEGASLTDVELLRRGKSTRNTRRGRHAHALSGRLASGLPAPGRQQPLLPPETRRLI